ncbi:3-deoxy-D-manno-octulosonic acid transferase [Acinetobacter lanii]|uniref:3-deoxy-D-manno-octulosonic acid transferase n=1 Tax=Acinetobacter lanii TaxID=2715163 RepID=A0A6G8S0T7_9GAMM|nr:3-deoxy-D-manno-octulosonic acid transferase [Acinetobacter lanii]QIO07725.1 3-deoxy-D-manno-octulosonic acid transferase [Acinetobacter lanii]
MTTPLWYNAALALIKPLYQWRIKKRASDAEQLQQESLERFGPFQTPKNLHSIWFHVVSVGETNAAQPLIEHYLKLGHPVLVTNTTKTGQARAKSLFLKAPYEALFQAVYLPADQKKLIKTFFAKYQPKMLVLVETELWPNLIAQAQQSQVPCVLVNARLSEKSAKGYGKVPSLTRAMLQGLKQLLAQDQASLDRFVALGAHPQQSQVVGSIKFDINAPQNFLDQAQQLKLDWQLQHRKIITLASTHAPEEQSLVNALKAYLLQDPKVVVIVVPRHPERFDAVYHTMQDLGLKIQRRSLGQSIEADTQVYLADSMGEMWLWYALSQVCFVGGSLNQPGGGHNILEPIALNVPTVVGPNYFNFQTIVDEFLDAHAVAVGANAEQVAEQLIQYVQQPELAKVMAEHAQLIMQKNAGSLETHIGVLDQYLTP